jgi:hypothetical protein
MEEIRTIARNKVKLKINIIPKSKERNKKWLKERFKFANYIGQFKGKSGYLLLPQNISETFRATLKHLPEKQTIRKGHKIGAESY